MFYMGRIINERKINQEVKKPEGDSQQEADTVTLEVKCRRFGDKTYVLASSMNWK